MRISSKCILAQPYLAGHFGTAISGRHHASRLTESRPSISLIQEPAPIATPLHTCEYPLLLRASRLVWVGWSLQVHAQQVNGRFRLQPWQQSVMLRHQGWMATGPQSSTAHQHKLSMATVRPWGKGIGSVRSSKRRPGHRRVCYSLPWSRSAHTRCPTLLSGCPSSCCCRHCPTIGIGPLRPCSAGPEGGVPKHT